MLVSQVACPVQMANLIFYKALKLGITVYPYFSFTSEVNVWNFTRKWTHNLFKK